MARHELAKLSKGLPCKPGMESSENGMTEHAHEIFEGEIKSTRSASFISKEFIIHNVITGCCLQQGYFFGAGGEGSAFT